MNSRKLLNLLFNNNFHQNDPNFVHRLLARPLMATTHIFSLPNLDTKLLLIDPDLRQAVLRRFPTVPRLHGLTIE